MLDLARYLLGVAEIALLTGFATLGASAVRARLLPSFTGAPAHLATAVIALALLIWVAELLGSFGLFKPVPCLVSVALVGLGLWLVVAGGRGYPSGLLGFSPRRWGAVRGRGRGEKVDAAAPDGYPRLPSRGHCSGTSLGHPSVVTVVALAVAGAALVRFGLDVKPKLTTGMTGFDSTWYHGPFAAGFSQSGSTWDLHFIAPQFLAWFYPANAELFHAGGILAFGRDLLSPLLNIGWFVGCLVACWCIGRPYKVAPWSLALGAVALSLPVLSDQAGEARNDIVGIFFLLAAVAIVLNAWAAGKGGVGGAVVVIGLAAGLAAGTKLNFLLPAAVLVLGLAFFVPSGGRWRALFTGMCAALAGGGYWYLRNLVHSGNPLPWLDSIGPVSLPAPDQALGGREGHSALGYLTDGSVWSDWFLPGLHDGLTILWPALGAAALAGLLLCLTAPPHPPAARSSFEPDDDPNLDPGRVLRLVGLVGLAAAFAWLVAPTSASGPDGMPRGFESGLRYLAPALVLGLSLLPLTSPLSERIRRIDSASLRFDTPINPKRGFVGTLALAAVLAAISIGYPVQRHYLQNRYGDPSFAAPGLNAAFKSATPLSGARIATTSTRQYPLFGTDLSNEVQYVGEHRPHGGFTPPTTCRRWREVLNEGNYDYAITTRDRTEPGKPPFPETAKWTEGPGAEVFLRKPPTVIYKLTAPLDPSDCH